MIVAELGDPPVVERRSDLFGWPEIVVVRGSGGSAAPEWCDVAVSDEAELAAVVDTVGANPLASRTLVELLRCAPDLDVASGLLAESASYAALQAGPEFAAWRASRRVRPIPPNPTPVIAERSDGVLRLTLHRPERHNALDASMRDALAQQLDVARLDPTVTSIVIDGSGPSFCSGGDLDEFGTAPNPAVAHLVRLERSLGRMLHDLSARTTVRLHGACLGSGIELAACAGRVTVTPDVSIGLPEVGLGLIPGAGGTVSLPQRIGRHRTAWLALTGRRIDAATALAWGLADEPAEPQLGESG